MLAHDIIARFLNWQRAQVTVGEYEYATLAYYERQLGKLAKLLPADLPAAEVKPWHLHGGPASWHFHQSAKRVFHWAMREGLLEADPLRNHKLPEPGQRERVLEVGELVLLLGACQPYFRDFLWCMVRMGARPGEVRTLRWRHIDLAKRIAVIGKYKGKRRRKVKVTARTIPLDADVTELLRGWSASRRPGPDDPVFTGRHGQPFSKDAVCRNFARARERVKLGLDDNGERAVPYTLRHTAGTDLTESEMTQKLLAEVLGHASMKTTERYQHVRAAAKVEAVDRAHAAGRKRGGIASVGRPQSKGPRQLTLFG